MNALVRLWQSLATLADAFERLAGLVHASADRIEQTAMLPAPEPKEVPSLPNGRSKRKTVST